MFKDKKLIILITVFVLAVFLRFWNLTSNDLYSDDALYSFRALGWFDYLGGGQTTPVQWFDQIPWWGHLSFHDAPPLVFAIQNLFFKIFGPNAWGARLPFALAGAGTVFLLYCLVKKNKGRIFALLAAFLLGISSYAVWASRVGYLEGVEVFFIVLSIFFFSRYVGKNNKYGLFYFGLASALAILCKYTAIFLIPAAIIYFLIWQRNVFRKKEIWLALLLFILVLSPVIIYNFNVFQARGHFDAALSSMVGMHPEDFKAISSRGLSFNFGRSIMSFWETLFTTASLPVVILTIISLFYLLVKIIKKQGDDLEKIFGLNLLMLFLMFLFLGAGPRFFSIATPLLIFSLTVLIFDFYSYLRNKQVIHSKVFVAILVLVFGWEFWYSFNTNILISPVGQPPLLYSGQRFYNLGFNQLDNYLQKRVFNPLPKTKTIKSFQDALVDLDSVRGKSLVLTDERISWFAYSWYLQKYPLIYNLPVFSLYNLFTAMPANSDPFDFLEKLGVADVYYILVVDESVIDPVKKGNTNLEHNMELFGNKLEQKGAKVESINNNQNKQIFKVYYFKYS